MSSNSSPPVTLQEEIQTLSDFIQTQTIKSRRPVEERVANGGQFYDHSLALEYWPNAIKVLKTREPWEKGIHSQYTHFYTRLSHTPHRTLYLNNTSDSDNRVTWCQHKSSKGVQKETDFIWACSLIVTLQSHFPAINTANYCQIDLGGSGEREYTGLISCQSWRLKILTGQTPGNESLLLRYCHGDALLRENRQRNSVSRMNGKSFYPFLDLPMMSSSLAPLQKPTSQRNAF